MTDLPAPGSSPPGPNRRRLAARLRLARAALWWERVWPAFWPALCVVGVFAVAALFDVLPLLPGRVHAGVLALFAFAFAAASLWGWRAAPLRRLARSHRGAAPHRAGERIAAPPARGARRSPERAARRRGGRAVGRASAPDDSGGAPIARRLAGGRPGAA